MKFSIRKIRRFWEKPASTQLLLVEAFAGLLLARISVSFLPFRWIAKWAGVEGLESRSDYPVSLELLRTVRWAVLVASKYSAWDTRCLVQCLTGKALLRRRGVQSTLVLGLNKTDLTRLSAHAWLKIGTVVILGGEEKPDYQAMAMFTEVEPSFPPL